MRKPSGNDQLEQAYKKTFRSPTKEEKALANQCLENEANRDLRLVAVPKKRRPKRNRLESH